jgi:hypothetical protein
VVPLPTVTLLVLLPLLLLLLPLLLLALERERHLVQRTLLPLQSHSCVDDHSTVHSVSFHFSLRAHQSVGRSHCVAPDSSL